MKSNVVIGLVIGAVVIIGGGYYLINITANDQSGANTQGGTTATAGKFTGSFAELASRGGSWKCTVDSSVGDSTTVGTVYVADGKVRGDFASQVSGYGNMESHMLSDGQDVYTWSSIIPQGVKTRMTTSAPSETATQTSGQGMSPGQSYSYDCQPWTKDASVFELPSTVTFKSY